MSRSNVFNYYNAALDQDPGEQSATGNCWRNTWPGSSSGQGRSRTGGIIAPEKFGRFWTIDRAILIAWKAAQGVKP